MTITIRLPEELEARLRRRLGADGLPLSEFVRQAISEKLAREPTPVRPSAYELGKHVFGRYSSGRDDLAENAESILREMLSGRHRR